MCNCHDKNVVTHRKWETLKEQLTSTPYLILTNAWVTLLAGSFHWPALVDSLRTERRRQLTVLAQNWQFHNSKQKKKICFGKMAVQGPHQNKGHLWQSVIQGRSSLESPSEKHKEHGKGEQNRIMTWGRGDERTWVLRTGFTIPYRVHFPRNRAAPQA